MRNGSLSAGAALLLLTALPLAAQDAAAPRPAVTVAPVTLEAIAASTTLNGRLEADARVDLRARVSGFLEEVTFAPGDIVEEGEVLFRIERAPYEAAVQEALGALRAAESVRDAARLARDRQAELFQRQTASQAALDEAEAALGRTEGDVTRLQGSLRRAELNLSYTEITAPFTGRIGVPAVDEGALVSPESGALATLISLDPIHAVAPIPTAMLRDFVEAVDRGEASAEGAATLVLANGSTYDLEGTVDFVDSAVSQGTDSVQLRARFENPQGRLLDDELVRVVLTQTTPAERLTIPQQAVQRDLQGAYVLVVSGDGAVERRRIDTGGVTEGLAIVTAGLEEGEFVITEGANKVRPGVAVDAAVATGN